MVAQEVFFATEHVLQAVNAKIKEVQLLVLAQQGNQFCEFWFQKWFWDYVLFSFGVCCVFIVSEAGRTINQNCTYIRNPGFPSSYGSTSGVSYTINKCSNGKSSQSSKYIMINQSIFNFQIFVIWDWTLKCFQFKGQLWLLKLMEASAWIPSLLQ